MGVYIYDIPPNAANEAARDVAVVESGVLALIDDIELARIVRDVADEFATRFASITVIHRDWQYLIAAHGLATGVTRRSQSFCSHAILDPDRAFVVLDAQADVRFAENPHVIEAPSLRFYAGAPLRRQPDVALGALCVFDTRPRSAFPDEAAAALSRHAVHVVARIAERANRAPDVAAAPSRSATD